MSTQENGYRLSPDEETALANELAGHLAGVINDFGAQRTTAGQQIGVYLPLLAGMKLLALLVADLSRQADVSHRELTEMTLRQLHGFLRQGAPE
jgi:hypothetical protein